MADRVDRADRRQGLADVRDHDGASGILLGRRQVLPPTGDEVVDGDDLVSTPEQRLDEVGSDQAGRAGDEDLHDPTPTRLGPPISEVSEAGAKNTPG